MVDRIEFETPENVLVSYQPAGLGTRWIGWFVDKLLLFLILIVTLIFLLFVGIGLGGFVEDLARYFTEVQTGGGGDVPLLALAIWWVLFGLSNFLYFGFFEYIMSGQTPGKRYVSIRVVKADGFSLDAGSILIRNLFRVIDHLPPLWIVPFISQRSQRLGDMVAGTVLIADEPATIGGLREELVNRPPEDTVFRFDNATLKRARPQDVDAVEQILDRHIELPADQRTQILDAICEPLARRLQVEPPPADQQLTFLIDFLSAEFKRQHRELG